MRLDIPIIVPHLMRQLEDHIAGEISNHTHTHTNIRTYTFLGRPFVSRMSGCPVTRHSCGDKDHLQPNPGKPASPLLALGFCLSVNQGVLTKTEDSVYDAGLPVG